MLTIIQNFFGQQTAFRDLGGKQNATYAAKRGYRFELSENAPPLGFAMDWTKIMLLSAWADKAASSDEAVWIDASAMIVRNEPLDGLIGGRDIGMTKISVNGFSDFYSADVIVVRKRSERLKAFFDAVFAAGPTGKEETLPVASNLATGRINLSLPSSGLNVFTLDGAYNDNPVLPAAKPIISNWRGCSLADIAARMKGSLGAC